MSVPYCDLLILVVSHVPISARWRRAVGMSTTRGVCSTALGLRRENPAPAVLNNARLLDE